MSNFDLRIRGRRGREMKITMAVRGSIFAAALGVACLLPTTVHAQAEVAPDHYELSHTDVTPAQSAPIASSKETKADFTGKFSLPYNVKCSGRNLRPGQYSIAVKSEGTSRVITIHGSSANVSVPARMVPPNQTASGSTLIVRKSGEGRSLEGIYLAELNQMLYVQTTASHGLIEHLPIS